MTGGLYNLTSDPATLSVSPATIGTDETTQSTTPSTLREPPVFTDINTSMMITNNCNAPLYLKFFETTPTGVVPSATDYDIIIPQQSVLSLPGTNGGIQVVSGASGSGKIRAVSWYVPA